MDIMELSHDTTSFVLKRPSSSSFLALHASHCIIHANMLYFLLVNKSIIKIVKTVPVYAISSIRIYTMRRSFVFVVKI
jgi:hypothetical protein